MLRARRVDRALIALFLLALAAPTVDRIARPEVAESTSAEMRRPARLPALGLDVALVGAFPAAFEAWFADTHGLRDKLLRWHNALHLFGLGVAPTPILRVGEERWLFYTCDQSTEVMRGLVPLDAAGREAYLDDLERKRAHLAGLGIDYFFVVAPNKESIYPERVPAELNRVGPTRLDQMLAHAAERPCPDIVDPRAALLAEKAGDAPGDHLYCPDGTHWTDRGAWAALGPVLERLGRDFPAVTRVPRERFRRRRLDTPSDDTFAHQLYLTGVLTRPEHAFEPVDPPRARLLPGQDAGWGAILRHTVVDDPRLPRVLLVHDSFGPWLRTPLAEQCSELVCVQNIVFPVDVIERVRPDVVIEMRTERCFACPIAPWVGNGERLSAADFEAAEPVAPARDATARLAAIEPFRGARVVALGDGGLAIDAEPPVEKVLLPRFEFPAGRAPVIRLEMTSPADTQLALWYRRSGDEDYRQAQCFRFQVAAGANDLVLFLPVTGVEGRLLLAPGAVAGRYVVHAVDARARAP